MKPRTVYADAAECRKVMGSRVLVRIHSVSKNREQVTVVIPSWDPLWEVQLPIHHFNVSLRDGVKPGQTYLGKAHLGAERESQLHVTVNRLATVSENI